MNWIPNILRRGNDGNTSPSLLDCLSLDLEVSPTDGRINALAAVCPDTEEFISFDNRGDRLDEALARLDALAENKAFVLGHNLIHFDLPRLQAIDPHLRLLEKPAVDTLMLNPLAFPQNPYHYLVKHYQDGQLRRGRINDPELDARLTLEVFENQQYALRGKDADLLAGWHWLTTVDGGEGFDIVFRTLRESSRSLCQMMLLYMSSSLGECLSGLLDGRVDFSSNIAFETADDFSLAHSLGGSTTHVLLSPRFITQPKTTMR